MNLEWAPGSSEPANVQLSNSTTLNYPNGGGNFAHTISGNLTVDTGSALYMDFGSPGTGVGLLTVGGDVSMSGNVSLGNQPGGDLRIGGNFTRIGAAAFNPNSRLVEFTGAVGKSITGATGFDYLTINNSGGISLNSDITVNQTLAFSNGKITTGANLVTIAPGGSISGASSTRYVNGNLKKRVNISAGTGNQTYEVGDASVYAPVSFSTISGSQHFDITSNTTAGVHPQLASSGIDGNKSVNRHWSLSSSPRAQTTSFRFDPGGLRAS